MGLEAGDTGDEAVVDIGADVTSICVHAWGVPRIVRILPSGGRDITSAVARSMGVTDDEAESMKRMAGSGRGDQVSTVTATRSSSFADEIRSSLEFYLTQMPGAKMGRVLVTGGGSKLPGLMQLLAERLPSPVAAGHAFGRVRNSLDMPADAMTEAEPLLAVAVGLAIPGVRG
jgi:type IV pilus assembly protein PilM